MKDNKLNMNEVHPGEDLLSNELEAIAGGHAISPNDGCTSGCGEGNVETPPVE